MDLFICSGFVHSLLDRLFLPERIIEMTSLLKLLCTDGYISVNKVLAKLSGVNEAILIGDINQKKIE